MTILVGNQRGGARDMALHLMKDENDHVAVHEIRGFVSETVMGALNESYAISKATKCKRHLYSLSANPPPDKQVSTEEFVTIIDRAEKALGLVGQPRVIVFHEKQGRRHAHCVWSRIKTDELKAVQLSYDHPKLVNLTRDIFIERGWKLPEGLIDRENRDPTRYTLAEYQQAKRAGRNAADIKADLQSAWAQSDNFIAFKHALREKGFWLARGDRGRFALLDHTLKPYSLSRWMGIKPKMVRDRYGEADRLNSVKETKAEIVKEMARSFDRLKAGVDKRANAAQARFEARKKALVNKQQAERKALIDTQERRMIAANQKRQERFRSGFSALWDRLRGEHNRIQMQNEREAFEQAKANQNARDEMIWRHLKERQRIEIFKLRHKERTRSIQQKLDNDRGAYRRSDPDFTP